MIRYTIATVTLALSLEAAEDLRYWNRPVEFGNFRIGANITLQENLSNGIVFAEKIYYNPQVTFEGIEPTVIGPVGLNRIDHNFKTSGVEYKDRWDIGFSLYAGWSPCNCDFDLLLSWDHNRFGTEELRESCFAYENFLRLGTNLNGAQILPLNGFTPIGTYFASPWNSSAANLNLSLLKGSAEDFDPTSFNVCQWLDGSYSTSWNLIRLQISHHSYTHRLFSLKPYLEVQYHRIDHSFNSDLNIVQAQEENPFEVAEPFFYHSKAHLSQCTDAIGLDIGLEPRFHLGQSLSIVGSFDYALLISHNSIRYKEAVDGISYLANPDVTAESLDEVISLRRNSNPVRQLFHLKLGFEWERKYCDLWGVSVRVGWEIYKYLIHYAIPKNWLSSAVDPVADVLDNQLPHPLAYPNYAAPNGDLTISGFFLGVMLYY